MAMGIRYLPEPGYELPMLNAVSIPDGVDDLAVRKQLLDEFNIEIGGGLGDFKGKAWRIGLMGSACTLANVVLVLAAIEKSLTDQGVKLKSGAGIAAAAKQASEC
jgi:alanine-glyoxylate transaminase/serine-glyoxylate transaminase/serine-pyruvate transaminase